MGAGQLRAEIDLRGWRDSILAGQIFPGWFWQAFIAHAQVVILL